VGLHALALSSKRCRGVRNVGVGLRNIGVGLKTFSWCSKHCCGAYALALGLKRRREVRSIRVVPYALASGLKCRGGVQNIDVGSYTPALGPKRHSGARNAVEAVVVGMFVLGSKWRVRQLVVEMKLRGAYAPAWVSHTMGLPLHPLPQPRLSEMRNEAYIPRWRGEAR
jgi:hypothetical protein